MYLTREAIMATLRQIASLAPGSTLAMTFLRPLELVAADERQLWQYAERGARGSGTPFISFFGPTEIVDVALAAGFTRARHVSAEMLNERYFAGRTDGLRTLTAEELVVAQT